MFCIRISKQNVLYNLNIPNYYNELTSTARTYSVQTVPLSLGSAVKQSQTLFITCLWCFFTHSFRYCELWRSITHLCFLTSRKKADIKEKKKEEKVHRKVTQCSGMSDLPVHWLQPLLGVEFLCHIHSWRRDHIIALNSVTGPIPFLIINLQAHHRCYPVSCLPHQLSHGPI